MEFVRSFVRSLVSTPKSGGAFSVTAIIIRNRSEGLSSNPGRSCLVEYKERKKKEGEKRQVE